METDASGIGIGAVLSQHDKEKHKFRPISFASRLLKGAELNYSTTDREALAIVWAIKKYKYVIYGYKIVVFTDHKPLTSLFSSTLPPGRLGRWALLVQEYDLTIRYKPGILNQVPDALSRYPVEGGEELQTGQVNVIPVDQPRKAKQPVAA